MNGGMRILLRLRYASDRTLFLPLEQVVDTMLHELVHIVRGPHDAQFHALWNQLRDEHESLLRKGYTGEGFLSEGRRLGGIGTPIAEARRLARVAAEKRRSLIARSTPAPGRRLGGGSATVLDEQDRRRAAADAAERRKRILRGCGNATHNDNEIQTMSESATRNSFKTKAEEDAANDAAIAQALWELVQEEERAKYGRDYVPPSAADPMGHGGGAVPRTSGWPSEEGYLADDAKQHDNNTEIGAEPGWACNICTLHNPLVFLCCDACGAERPADNKPPAYGRDQTADRKLATASSSRRSAPPVVDLTGSSSSSSLLPLPRQTTQTRNKQVETPQPKPAATWMCSFCGNIMAREWWSCSRCATIKDHSR